MPMPNELTEHYAHLVIKATETGYTIVDTTDGKTVSEVKETTACDTRTNMQRALRAAEDFLNKKASEKAEKES